MDIAPSSPRGFEQVETWVFDLDNTLYPPHMRLFDQIELRMARFMQRKLGVDEATAHALRRQYWEHHGTTLAGLMTEHGVEPMAFLHDVHDIDFSVLSPDPVLAQRLAALPGRKIVYTNGDVHYAGNVLEARGLGGIFAAVYGIENAGFQPKPSRAAYDQVFERDGLDPARAAMFEDDPRNLEAPYAMGLTTVHVAPAPDKRGYIDHHTDDLTAFLAPLV